MSMSSNLHGATHAEAMNSNGCTWLTIIAASGDFVSIFMPFDKAEAMAAAFNTPIEAPVLEQAQ